MEDYAFKLVCIDDSSPLEFVVLDDVNRSTLTEIHEYMMANAGKYDLNSCKWLLLPIHKTV